MQAAHAAFEACEKFGGLALRNIERLQIAPGIQMNEAAAENDSVRAEQAPPKIRQIHRVEGFSRGETQRFDLHGLQGRCGCSKGEPWLRPACQAVQFERFGIGGDQRPFRADFFAANMQPHAFFECNLVDAGTCLLLRLKIQGLVKDGLLGAVGFLIAFYTIVYLPWPSNAAMKPADAVAYTVAGILPVVHHVYRRVAQH